MMGADLCKHPRESRGGKAAWLPLIVGALAVPALAAAARAQQSGSGGSVAHLPHDLSPWGMFMSADIIVQGVMIGLFIASVVTWTVGLAKSLELFIANRRLREALRRISAEGSLLGALNRLEGGRGLARTMLETAVSEVRCPAPLPMRPASRSGSPRI
jgi:biopolymer transport protein ExbB